MSPSGQPAAPRFDYDEGDIHRTYSAGRALSPMQAAFWTAVLRAELGATSVRRVLDLGCGVGRFSRLLREALGARVHGADRSAKTYADRFASRTVSTLQVVSDAEFIRGMAEFRRYCEREDRGEVVENAIDVFVLAAPPRRA